MFRTAPFFFIYQGFMGDWEFLPIALFSSLLRSFLGRATQFAAQQRVKEEF
jgi:hypothetical protein